MDAARGLRYDPQSIVAAVRSLPRRYEKHVLLNAPSLGYMESGLRALLFLAPGCRDSELLLEMGYTVLGFLSLYHDVIVLRYLQRNKKDEKLATTLRQNQGLIIGMSIVQNSELLLEIASLYKWGEKGRWIVVVVVELLKLALRLALFRRSGTSILHQQKIPDRGETVTEENVGEFTPEKVQLHQESDGDSRIPETALETGIVAKPEGHEFGYVELAGKASKEHKSRHTLLESYKVNGVKTSPSVLVPKTQHGPSRQRDKRNVQIGEYCYIFRPALYLLAMYICGRKSWIPWLLSLALDVSGAWYSATAGGLSPAEREELSRRRFNWFYYLLRAPFFEAFFSHTSILEKLRTMPLLGAVGSIVDYVDTYRDYHFYLNS